LRLCERILIFIPEGVDVENPLEPECKCYLSPEGKGLIRCPFCGFGKAFDFNNKLPSNRRAYVRCKCGKKFQTFLEVRQHYRKSVKLSGEYTNMTSMRSGRMIVEDISQAGIGFRVTGFEYFKKDDLLKATFTLDDKMKSGIALKGAVRHIRGNFIGCRILHIPEGQRAFGFYLLP
jgi:hypothetical protein